MSLTIPFGHVLQMFSIPEQSREGNSLSLCAIDIIEIISYAYLPPSISTMRNEQWVQAFMQ